MSEYIPEETDFINYALSSFIKEGVSEEHTLKTETFIENHFEEIKKAAAAEYYIFDGTETAVERVHSSFTDRRGRFTRRLRAIYKYTPRETIAEILVLQRALWEGTFYTLVEKYRTFNMSNTLANFDSFDMNEELAKLTESQKD